MQLQHIPLGRIKISRLNMRHSRKHPDVSDILPSIRKLGIAQRILVRKEGKDFGVIAGRRRWFSLKRIAKEEGGTIKVLCEGRELAGFWLVVGKFLDGWE